MFVMLVGVISVFSLIALGRFEMLEGSKADRAMSIRSQAPAGEMLARGYLRPVQMDIVTNQYLPMWVTPSGTCPWGPSSMTITATAPAWPLGSSPIMPFDGGTPTYPYAIDPLGVAANSTSYATPGTPAPSTPNPLVPTLGNFPAFYLNSTPPGAGVPMTRMTLRSAPYANSVTPAEYYQMSVTQADAIFRSQDDLVLNPLSGDYPASQEFALTPLPAPQILTRRQSNGDYSWLATVAPIPGDTRACLMSIVVFYKRNFILPSGVPPQNTAPPERMVNCLPATGNSGIGGGDIILSCPSTFSPDYIKVRPNQWILLSQTPTAPGFWRWYRVTATSDPANNGTICPNRASNARWT